MNTIEMTQLTLNFERQNRLLSPNQIFDLDDGDLIAVLEEDRRIERKVVSIQERELAAYVCMWANTPPTGGILAIGIADNGEITGIHSSAIGHINNLEKLALLPQAPG